MCHVYSISVSNKSFTCVIILQLLTVWFDFACTLNFDGGNSDVFQLDRQMLNPSNTWKTLHHLQVHGERQWPSIKIFSVKCGIHQNFPHQKFALYGTLYAIMT